MQQIRGGEDISPVCFPREGGRGAAQLRALRNQKQETQVSCQCHRQCHHDGFTSLYERGCRRHANFGARLASNAQQLF
eukprot:103878-Rhodomonas_salina.1